MKLFEGLSRREWLAGLAAVGASSVLPAGLLRGQAPTSANPRRLDMHQHFASPRYAKRIADAKRIGYEAIQNYDPAKAVESLDQGGVQRAFISGIQPGLFDFAEDRAEAIALARDMNEYGARMASDYKGRFGLFALLPLPDIDASLKEIEYAFGTLKADGVGLLTNYGDIWLGDDKLRPVFEELNRRNAIVYSHPVDASCCHTLDHALPDKVEWLTDTGRSIHSVINDLPLFNGQPLEPGANRTANQPARMSAATRYSNIKFIWSHAGGTLIAIASRIVGNISGETLSKPAAPNSRLYHIRRFYYDTAGSTNPILMQGLKMLAGASQIVFGSDRPYGNPANIAKGLQTCGFTAAELRGIDRENALRMLPKDRNL